MTPGSLPFLRPALFLDRDDTLIVDVPYPRDPGKVALLPGAAEVLGCLRGRGYALVIVSNQAGVGRGLIAPEEAAAVHARCAELLAHAGVPLDGAYYCFHHPDAGCSCRKPAPGLILQAARELGLDLARSFMIGDKVLDVAAGAAAGCRTILFGRLASLETIDGISPTHRAATWEQVEQLLPPPN